MMAKEGSGWFSHCLCFLRKLWSQAGLRSREYEVRGCERIDPKNVTRPPGGAEVPLENCSHKSKERAVHPVGWFSPAMFSGSAQGRG